MENYLFCPNIRPKPHNYSRIIEMNTESNKEIIALMEGLFSYWRAAELRALEKRDVLLNLILAKNEAEASKSKANKKAKSRSVD